MQNKARTNFKVAQALKFRRLLPSNAPHLPPPSRREANINRRAKFCPRGAKNPKFPKKEKKFEKALDRESKIVYNLKR